jgi:hypothetical protein
MIGTSSGTAQAGASSRSSPEHIRPAAHRAVSPSVALVLLLLLGAAACTSEADAPTPTPTSEAPGAPNTATPSPAPTPTPVPLPQVCLLPQFAEDVENCGSIPLYEIALAVDPSNARVVGHQDVRYTNLEGQPLFDLYLRLFPNTPAYGGVMTVTDVLLDGREAASLVELEGTALRVPLVPTLLPGRSVELAMDFQIDVPTTGLAGHGLFSYLRGVMALPTAYAIIPVYDDERWNLEIAPEYGDDTYSDIAAYEVQITAPAEMTLAASGSCVADERAEDSTIWSCEAGPMRDFVLVLSERFQMANRIVGQVVVNSYYYPEHVRGGGKALDTAAEALAVFSELFGPYPYSELDVVETPNYLNGMEYPGLVVIADRLYPGVGGVEWLAAHETAHQWWFGAVGSDQIDDPWLDEALTQYSTMLYYEMVYGREVAATILNSQFLGTYETLVQVGRDMPAGLPASAYGPELYWDIVYDKGALYFHYLREEVGDEPFFDILRAYFIRHRYGIATPESFLNVVESVTGDRHQDVFDQWIGGS